MSSSFATAPVDSFDHGRHNASAAERLAERRRLVGIVVAAYRAVCDLSPVIACNYDITVWESANRWSADSCHYQIDVENAVRRVIESKPDADRPALWAAWEKLLTDDARIDKAEERLVKAIAPRFFANKLHPSVYFKPNRYPQKGGTR